MTADERDEREDGDRDEWDPEPATFREGAHSDVSGHAARNIELLRGGVRDGAISTETARESIARIRDENDQS